MKISSLNPRLNADRGALMQVKYHGKPVDGVKIAMRGMESTDFMQRMKEYNRLKAERGDGWDTSEEAAEHFRETIIAAVVGSEGLEDDNGKPLTPDKLQKLLRDDDYLDLVTQLIEFAKERDNFFARADVPS